MPKLFVVHKECSMPQESNIAKSSSFDANFSQLIIAPNWDYAEQKELVSNKNLDSKNDIVSQLTTDTVNNVRIIDLTNREKSDPLFNSQESFNHLRSEISTEIDKIQSLLNEPKASSKTEEFQDSVSKIKEYLELAAVDLDKIGEVLESNKEDSRRRAGNYKKHHEKIHELLTDFEEQFDNNLKSETDFKDAVGNGQLIVESPDIISVHTRADFQDLGSFSYTTGSYVEYSGLDNANDENKEAKTFSQNESETNTESEIEIEIETESEVQQVLPPEESLDQIVPVSIEERPSDNQPVEMPAVNEDVLSEQQEFVPAVADIKSADIDANREIAFEKLAVENTDEPATDNSVFDEEPAAVGTATMPQASGVIPAEETMIGGSSDTHLGHKPLQKAIRNPLISEETPRVENKIYSGEEIYQKIGKEYIDKLESKKQEVREVAMQLSKLLSDVERFEKKNLLARLVTSHSKKMSIKLRKERYQILKVEYDKLLLERSEIETTIKDQFNGLRYNTNGAPKALNLVSVPSVKYNSLPSINQISSALDAPLQQGSMFISRQGEKIYEGGRKPDDVLELRPYKNGKFKIYLNGEKIAAVNTAYADDAFEIAKKFKNGNPGAPIRFKKLNFSEYTIIPNDYYIYN